MVALDFSGKAANLAEIHAELIVARAMLRVHRAHLRMFPRLELFHHALQVHLRTPCDRWHVSTGSACWTVTALFCLQISFTAYAQLRLPQMAETFAHLGFPDYFRVGLSWSKLLGVALLLAPVPPRRDCSTGDGGSPAG